ncbi:helix-turn-helix domain-containing protein [Scytonema tolypothrichoides VB-61278]|nr:helix-turn-helix domain-containing protein [Scytonema tolypothrichoides VB-61278]
MDTLKLPRPQESLADYIKRIRTSDGMTQFELAIAAGIHSRSVGKIERGLTTRLNRKTLLGLAGALGIPQEYLEAVERGESVKPVNSVKFCPQCWTPGAVADSLWSPVKAKFCYLCGMQLRTNCAHCGELVVSLKYKFCPMCGKPYKAASQNL